MNLWNIPEDESTQLISLHFSKYGELIGSLTTHHSRIFTFDSGPQVSPRYVIAKTPRIHEDASNKEIQSYLSRCIVEANNAFTVAHHHLIHSFFHAEVFLGAPFLLSRKRERNLADVIAEGPLQHSQLLANTVQLSHAINYLKAHGLIAHQDLKPENVYVDSWPKEFPIDSKLHVADFELANAFLLSRKPFGSRPYMAPEQYAFDPEDVAGFQFSKVDSFAIGVITYEMMTGGVHPVGERLDAIWPKPQDDVSRKWLRDTPWKKWIGRGAPIAESPFQDESIMRIIEGSMNVNFEHRWSVEKIETEAMKYLKMEDERVADSLILNLEYFDESAEDSETLGWPFYQEMLEALNNAFD